MNSLRYKPVAMMLAMTATACTVGPDYREPPKVLASPLGSKFVRDDRQPSSTIEAVERWWLTINDDTLNGLIEKALASSPQIEIANARVRQARALRREQLANRLPSVSASGLGLAADLPAGSLALGGGGDQQNEGDRTSAQFYNLGIDASWEIDLFGGRRRAAEAAGARAEGAEASIADAQVRLAAEVGRTYISLRRTQAELSATREIIRGLEQESTLAAQRLQRGSAGESPLAQTRGQLEATTAEAARLNSELLVLYNQIAVLTGSLPGQLDAMLEGRGGLPLPPASVFVGDPAALLRRRPDIRAAERQVAAATADIGVNVARQFPTISLRGIIGLGGPNIADVVDPGNVSLIAPVQLMAPLLDFGRNRARIDQSKAARDEAVARYRAAVLEAFQDAENGLARFSGDRMRAVASDSAWRHAKREEELAEQRFRAGATSLSPVLAARRNRLSAEQSAVRATASLTTSFVDLQKSLGLGWSEQLVEVDRNSDRP